MTRFSIYKERLEAPYFSPGRVQNIRLSLLTSIYLLFFANLRASDVVLTKVDFRDYTLEVISAFGNPSPGVGLGTYAWRSTVSCTAGTEPGYTSNGWTGTGSIPAAGAASDTGPVVLDELTSSITWNWQVQNDSDSDGLSDSDEAEAGTDPGVADSDGDGLLDGQEVNIYGTNPLIADTDGDGFKDGFEIGEDCFDPIVDNSAVFAYVVSEIQSSSAYQKVFGLYTESSVRNVLVGAPLIQVDAQAGQVVLDLELQRADSLVDADWQRLELIQFIDSNVGDKLFYRIVVGD